MAVETSGVVDLGEGWTLALPNPCMAGTNPDGSWSAWDTAHTIDVTVISARFHDGLPDAGSMIGAEPNVWQPDWVGRVDEPLVEHDDDGPVHRVAITATAGSTLLSCWVSYRGDGGRAWADRVCDSIRFNG